VIDIEEHSCNLNREFCKPADHSYYHLNAGDTESYDEEVSEANSYIDCSCLCQVYQSVFKALDCAEVLQAAIQKAEASMRPTGKRPPSEPMTSILKLL
jgi:hypothetical protein